MTENIDRKTQHPRNPWYLKNDSVKPKPAVGVNTGSKDTCSTVGGGDLRADPLHVGNAVSAPPKPDDLPVAACADVKKLALSWDELYDQWRAKCIEVSWLHEEINTHKDIIAEREKAIAEIALRAQSIRESSVIGYAVIPDIDGMIIHNSEKSAREEAAHLIVEESDAYSTAHLVAILDTAELAIKWSLAA